MWENQFLEAELERDRYHEAHQEKIEADKEIILREMFNLTKWPLYRELI